MDLMSLVRKVKTDGSDLFKISEEKFSMDDFRKMVESFSWDDFDGETLSKLEQTLGYTGFDPVLLKKRIESLLHAACSSKEEALETLQIAIYLYNTRGNNVKKMKQRTSADGVTIIDKLVTALQIRNRVKGQNRQTVITLGRISLCFPILSISFSHLKQSQFVVSPEQLNSLIKCDEKVPKAFCNNAFAAIIPEGELGDVIAKAYLVYQFLFSDKVVVDYSKLATPEEQAKFIDNGRKSTLVTNESRIKLCVEYGVMVLVKVPEKPVKTTASARSSTTTTTTSTGKTVEKLDVAVWVKELALYAQERIIPLQGSIMHSKRSQTRVVTYKGGPSEEASDESEYEEEDAVVSTA